MWTSDTLLVRRAAQTVAAWLRSRNPVRGIRVMTYQRHTPAAVPMRCGSYARPLALRSANSPSAICYASTSRLRPILGTRDRFVPPGPSRRRLVAGHRGREHAIDAPIGGDIGNVLP